MPPDLAEALASSACLGRLGRRVTYYPTIGSTNDVAADVARESDADGAVIMAGSQTAGRGRRGHTWFSPGGAGLYVSVVLSPGHSVAPQRATGLVTLMAGVALARGVEDATGLNPEIKWPNDLLVGRRKLAGILSEAVSMVGEVSPAPEGPGRLCVVVGFGLNVSTSAFPPELVAHATSLETELGRAVDRAAVCVRSLEALARYYDDLVEGRFDAILSDWRERAAGSRGRRVRWDGMSGPRSGTTAGIDDDGALLVRVGDRVERIVAGAVTWE